MRRQSKDMGEVLSGLLDEVTMTQQTINEQLPHIKKYYSYIGSEGNQTRQENLVNRYIDEAAVQQAIGISPSAISDVLSDFSPRLAELIEKNPSLISTAMPKLQQYLDMRKTQEKGSILSDKPSETTKTDDDLSWVHQGNLG